MEQTRDLAAKLPYLVRSFAGDTRRVRRCSRRHSLHHARGFANRLALARRRQLP
jgi:hypothetical protein